MNLPSLPDLPNSLEEFAVQLAATVAGGLILRHGESKERRRADEKFRLRTEAHIQTLAHRVASLTTRFESLEAAQERISASLEEPDVWVLLEVSKTAAGFTSSELKRSALNRAVAERLIAETDSMEALASSHAVEISAKLPPAHLDLLGLAALIYQIRPPESYEGWIPEPFGADLDLNDPAQAEEYRRRNEEIRRKQGEVEDRYLEWFINEIARYEIDAHPQPTLMNPKPRRTGPSETETAHLTAVSAILYDRHERRDLEKVLAPWREHGDYGHVSQALWKFLRNEGRSWALQRLWNEWLQFVTLTPSGLLIGVAVQDFKAGTHTPLDLAGSTYISAGRARDPLIWGGRGHGISREFMDALDSELRQRHERGSGFIARLKKEY